jgi:hypothetical protein
MARLSWYWHRLKAMTPVEMGLRAHRRLHQLADWRWRARTVNLEPTDGFPRLPIPEQAPDVLRQTLQLDTTEILAGRWKAFGNLTIQVDDPPRWHHDYLSGRDLATAAGASKLDHRELPEGADIKLIWELSRWHQLVRLAMASYVLRDSAARRKCLEWLEDWVIHNPAYRGWNWTSALEVGMRLVQFTWIDALLSHGAIRALGGENNRENVFQRLKALRQAVLPEHLRFTWRHRSFGSSANNHLLGELAGCVIAVVRWPGLAEFAAPLTEMQRRWEREVLAQFAEDGGNREQALNYHLFSFEFCWYTLKALEAAGRPVSTATRERLALAGRFFRDVQVTGEPWDYGDSDSAFVSPLFSVDAVKEWHAWLAQPSTSPSISYWLGESGRTTPNSPAEARSAVPVAGIWRVYSDSGMVICQAEAWSLRWDVSPLGYLSTAAHGHLDALHLSVWCGGIALVVDPGTGAYYSDKKLRAWLSSRAAHNAPCPDGEEKPRRVGPFLWTEHHPRPEFHSAGSHAEAELDLWGIRISRRVSVLDGGRTVQVDDACFRSNGRPAPFSVRWQFAPGTWLSQRSKGIFSVKRGGLSIIVEVAEHWSAATVGEGVVSPMFRQVCEAPFLQLTAGPNPDPGAYLRTTFRDSERA